MLIKKLTVLTASVLGLIGSTMVASAESVDSGAKFSLALRLGGVVSKDKATLKLSNNAIVSVLNQKVRYDATANHFKSLRAMSDVEINECQGAGGKEIQHSHTESVAPNIVKIMANRYTPVGNENQYSIVEAWSSEASSLVAKQSDLNISGMAALAAGVKTGNTTIALNLLGEMRFKGKTSTVSFVKESTTDSKDKDKKDNKSSDSKKDTTFDVSVKHRMAYGLGFSFIEEFNPCLALGLGAGWKRYNYELDVTNPNTNFLGLTGTPKYDAAKKIKAENTTDKNALKHMRPGEAVNKLNASMDVMYAEVFVMYNFNQHVSAVINFGIQSGGQATLKNGKEKLTNADYILTAGASLFGGCGVVIKLI